MNQIPISKLGTENRRDLKSAVGEGLYIFSTKLCLIGSVHFRMEKYRNGNTKKNPWLWSPSELC
jgi:hypothetical protein